MRGLNSRNRIGGEVTAPRGPETPNGRLSGIKLGRASPTPQFGSREAEHQFASQLVEFNGLLEGPESWADIRGQRGVCTFQLVMVPVRVENML